MVNGENSDDWRFIGRIYVDLQIPVILLENDTSIVVSPSKKLSIGRNINQASLF